MPVAATAVLLALYAALRSRRAALVSVGIAVGIVGAAFCRPLWQSSQPGGSSLNRYAPLVDGRSTLAVVFDEAGDPVEWLGRNDRLLPAGLALANELHPAFRRALSLHMQQPGEAEPDDAVLLERLLVHRQLYQARARTLRTEGDVVEMIHVGLRTEEGDFVLGAYRPQQGDEVVFTPPLHTLPGELHVGDRWQSVGVRTASGREAPYEFHGTVTAMEAIENEAGRFADCLKVEAQLIVGLDRDAAVDVQTTYWYAPDDGLVEWRETIKDRATTRRGVVIGRPDRPPVGPPPPVAETERASSAPSDAEEWVLSHITDLQHAVNVGEPTIQPVYVPSTPPLIVAAALGGDLTAIALADDAPVVAWRYHVRGAVFGTPCWDERRACIYFGATDKRLHAVDARGLVLWSFRAGDNVGTRPVVVDDIVVFGGEDGHVYAVSAADGALRWRRTTGGPIVSSPAVLGDRIVIGSDDGNAYAFEPATGAELWSTSVGGPVEAIVPVDEETVCAAAHDGSLSVLARDDGRVLWSRADAGASSVPAVDPNGTLYVVEAGKLSAMDARTGNRLWTAAGEDLIGSPIVRQSEVFVAAAHGEVRRYDRAGTVRRRWRIAESKGAGKTAGEFVFGPSPAGDELLLVDARANIYRLGPRMGPEAVDVAWRENFASPPFQGAFFNVTPIPTGDRLVVVDDARNVYVVKPQADEAKRLGAFGERGIISVEPVVSGDVLLALAGTKLYAVGLGDGRTRWEFETGGVPMRPPAVDGKWVHVIVQDNEPAEGSSGTLFTLDRASGAVRRRRTLGLFAGPGEVRVAERGLLVGSPPSLIDIDADEPIWSAAPTDLAIGGLEFDETSDILYAGLIDGKANACIAAAIRVADGADVWRTPLGASPLHPYEKMWRTGDRVIVPLWSGEVVGLDAATGAERWRFTPPIPRRGGITVASGKVWLLDQNLRLTALDVGDGVPVGRSTLDLDLSTVHCFSPRPVFFGERVVAAAGSQLAAWELPRSPQ